MSFEQLWGIGFLTVLAFALLAGLFYLERALRNRLFPEERVRDRGEAMKVLNRHSRRLHHSPESLGERLDTLATRRDALWPHERWPRMAFDRPLEVGAVGGHGPIRYVVEEFRPGRQVVLRFTNPKGFHGTHRYTVEGCDGGCELRHTIDMHTSGSAVFSWPLVVRPLHDALPAG